jgi:hypothetical protein
VVKGPLLFKSRPPEKVAVAPELIVKLPPSMVVPPEKVAVAPELNVRLPLYMMSAPAVRVPFATVRLPPLFTVIAPEVRAPPETVQFPFTARALAPSFRVPYMFKVLLPDPVTPPEEALTVAPRLIVKVQDVFMVMAPEVRVPAATVKVPPLLVLFMVSVPMVKLLVTTG